MMLAIAGLGLQQSTLAQDSLKQETIDIISTYQPKLRDAAKLNLTASLPGTDTARPRLLYQVPAQNLYFMYQPVPLKPLALGKDSLAALQNNFVKVGYGNYNTPLIQAGIGSNRNEKFNYGLYGSYRSSKGDIQYQDYSALNVLASGTYYSPLFEINGSVGVDRNVIHYYGYDHTAYDFSKSDVRQAFTQAAIDVGLKNRPQNEWALMIAPKAKFVRFTDAFERKENTVIINAPVSKQLIQDLFLKAEGVFDFSTFKEDNQEQINNNVVAIHPAFEIIKPGFTLHAGVNPTWTNSKFYLLPDIVNESHLIRKKVILSSGWISYIDKNSFRNLANKNPFIGQYGPDILNTRVEEKYTGIKGTLGSHFNYNTKFAAVTWHNLPLFVNDTVVGNTFVTRNEDQLRAFQLHAEIGYIEEEKFQVRLSGDWYNFNKQNTEVKAWHMVPFQANVYGQYTVGKHLHLDANLYALSGSWYQMKNKDFAKTKGAWDLNAGANYDIGRNFNVWVTANNLFNTHYQRWNGYPTYGFNIVGGVMIKF
jgi:hypothetical protein